MPVHRNRALLAEQTYECVNLTLYAQPLAEGMRNVWGARSGKFSLKGPAKRHSLRTTFTVEYSFRGLDD